MPVRGPTHTPSEVGVSISRTFYSTTTTTISLFLSAMPAMANSTEEQYKNGAKQEYFEYEGSDLEAVYEDEAHAFESNNESAVAFEASREDSESKIYQDSVAITIGDDTSYSSRRSEKIPLRKVSRSKSILLIPGMKLLAHEIKKDGSLVKCDQEDALGGAHAGTGNYWIDIDADDRDLDQLRVFLDQLELPSFLTRSLAKPVNTWSPQVAGLKHSSLLVIRILPDEYYRRETAHLAAICVNNLLVTFTSCPRRSKGGIAMEALMFMAERERIPGASSSGALLAWLMFHVDRTSHAMRDLRTRVLEMMELMDESPSSVLLEDIVVLRDHLLQIVSVTEEHTESLESLAEAESDTDALDFDRLRGTLGVLRATAGSNLRMALRVEKRIADIRQTYESNQQERINGRLAVLTVLSALFLPLTLMAGIYGMNFENMPELGYENSYYLLLGAMGFVATVMLCFFWRTGWFR
jgi:Mg2+ and Co2+ transporter CorA